ncbi:AAA family ATPase [Myxococcus stipitatus]|uniref:ATP-binding protein n=1 Tax=Myxococcus stipitatus TaxID=83455 RepID=UPI001F390054|nr:AAA family ATPase [Myxococcus stipitatus]MCE9672834.1 AAA family ATPase [Myxococcus stipitatus]
MTTASPSLEESPARSGPEGEDWAEANQRHLSASLARVRVRLEQHAARQPMTPDPEVEQALEEATRALPTPSSLERLCALFQLSPFERDVLLLVAGVELDERFAALCARAQGAPTRTWPTFSLALAALPQAHWSAVTPASALRRWRLVELAPGEPVTTAPLRIDERTLHHLTGVQYLDERLMGFVEDVEPPRALVPSHRQLVERISALWARPHRPEGLPVVQLVGADASCGRAIAAAACAHRGLGLLSVMARCLPTGEDTREVHRRLTREAELSRSLLLLDFHGLEAGDSGRLAEALRLLDRAEVPMLVSSPERLRALDRPGLALEVSRPTPMEQRLLWEEALRSHAPDVAELGAVVEPLVSQFDLSAPLIDEACQHLRGDERQEAVVGTLWEACRHLTRPRTGELAQRITSSASWEELVLPQPQTQLLRELAAQVRHRARVYGAWRMGSKSSRGLGITAMFAGQSGTGKTLAAEVLANELKLDLHRIDLSQVVNKYIGETEKNLRRIFDAAEEGGTLLLFDEADALFGKRSEVSDSHDRYANIEVSYLLQRMESYRGLAILTTNMKESLDVAFLRRLRFVVDFPFPGPAERRELWRRVFPPQTPTQDLDYAKLAELSVAGGNISIIALNAAFLAAEDGSPVRMSHIWRAAQTEFAKLEKPRPPPL